MSCDRCKQLEERLEKLRIENLEIEERRSRERTRFLELEQDRFLKALNPPEALRVEDFNDLLDLLRRVIEDPKTENLLHAKSQLEKYLV